jgi:hypothetical protein
MYGSVVPWGGMLIVASIYGFIQMNLNFLTLDVLCRRVWQPCCAVGFHCDSVQLQIIEIEYYPSLNTP